MKLWTKSSLAVVASAIEKPLLLDLANNERHHLSFVHIYVGLNGVTPMPAEITVNLRGVDFIVFVNYEWKPIKCNLCRAFGHSGGKRPRNVENKTHREEDVSMVVSHKGDDMTSVACGDVVLELFKQLEEEEINCFQIHLLSMRRRRWGNEMNLLLSLVRNGSWHLFAIGIKN